MNTDTPTTKAQRSSKTAGVSPNTRCPVSVRLPSEFKALCDRQGLTMAQVIKVFAADLCAIAPLSKQARYVSTGLAAQAAARAYYAAAGFGDHGGSNADKAARDEDDQ